MLSNLDIFSDAQAVTATAVSTNAVYVGKFAGQGEPIDIVARVVADFATLTSLAVSIREATTEGGSYTDIISVPTVALASLVIGYEFKFTFLPRVESPWIKLNYTVTGSNATAGKITALLRAGRQGVYKDGLFFKPRNPTGAASTA